MDGCPYRAPSKKGVASVLGLGDGSGDNERVALNNNGFMPASRRQMSHPFFLCCWPLPRTSVSTTYTDVRAREERLIDTRGTFCGIVSIFPSGNDVH